MIVANSNREGSWKFSNTLSYIYYFMEIWEIKGIAKLISVPASAADDFDWICCGDGANALVSRDTSTTKSGRRYTVQYLPSGTHTTDDVVYYVTGITPRKEEFSALKCDKADAISKKRRSVDCARA